MINDFLREMSFILPISLIAMILIMFLLRNRSRVQPLELQGRSTQPETPAEMAGKPLKVEFGPCCFCGKDVPKTEKEPLCLNIQTRDEHWQAWVCHAHCFRERLYQDSTFEPVHF